MSAHDIQLVVNGQPVSRRVEARRLLATFLRDDLRLTGTHIGCDSSQCGACTVVIDGEIVKSCTVLAVQADGCSVETIESVADGLALGPVQRAFQIEHGLQCGFCTPGLILAVRDLLRDDADPDEETIRHALHGNICRCTGYHNIVKAVQTAARLQREARLEAGVAQ